MIDRHKEELFAPSLVRLPQCIPNVRKTFVGLATLFANMGTGRSST